jgi:predicted enzyme related to lactoylglutathione lyase
MNEQAPNPSIGFVLDCADPVALAAFWTPALGYTNAGSTGNYVALAPKDSGPMLLLQRVEEPKTTKNRMHLDLHDPDVEGLVRRLEGLGAKRLIDEPRREAGMSWIVMADPEGNEFCVCDGGCC